MSEHDSLFSAVIPFESIKVVAESIGISNLPDDAARELADDVSYRLKHVIQDAAKFMLHSKRQRLLSHDIDHSLKIKNIEPLYGFSVRDNIPFRFASGGGRELFFIEEKDVDLNELIASHPVRLPLEVTLKAHWLSIDGIQPTIPENPAPVSKDIQKVEATDPVKKLIKPSDSQERAGKPTTGKTAKLRNVETVHVKQLATHELSVEQQLYYKEITEACAGPDEGRRVEALQSLAMDPGLHEMLPRICTFISEGVKVNVVQHNLALLIYLLRMVKALLENPNLYLEKYLHELIPTVITCIVSKQLCARPDNDNHWALRGFAARLMAQICKNFNTSTNDLQTRVTRIFAQAVNNDNAHLSSLYGALEGLSHLGTEVVKIFILPRAKQIADRLDNPLVMSDKCVSHIKALLIKALVPILKTRSGPDILEEYKTEFGSLGPDLYSSVKAKQPNSKLQSSPTPPLHGNEVVVATGSGVGRSVVVTGRPPTPSQQKFFIISPRQSAQPSVQTQMFQQVYQSQSIKIESGEVSPQSIKIENEEIIQ